MVGNDPPRVLGVMRITPVEPVEHFVYSLEVKRDFRRMVHYECPAKLPPAVTAEVERQAFAAFAALGCRDVARIDFRLRDGVPYFLEINPLPGLNPESSDLVIMADLLGITHAQLVGRILDAATQRLFGTAGVASERRSGAA
jgi:D-alanine-D-alanine ligase